LGKSATKLEKNSDFKKTVMQGYFIDEAARLALLVSDPMISPELRAAVMRDIDGVGAFKRYLSFMVQMGQQAERSIEENEQTLQEIREENDNFTVYGSSDDEGEV
jgi:signal transduction protein with GAF and PtsI domain